MNLNNNIKGAIYLTLAYLIACLDNVFIHYVGLSGSQISPAQIFFLKMFSALIFISIAIIRKDKTLFKSRCMLLQIFKSILGAAGNFIWVLSLTHLPLSSAVCLSMSSVFFNYLGSVLFLQESLQFKRVFCTCIGFLGIAYYAQSKQVSLGVAIFFPIVSAFFLSAASILIKPITKRDSVLTTLFYLFVTMSVLGAPAAFKSWSVLTVSQTLSLMFLGISYIGTIGLLVYAYKIAEISFISPFKFSKLPLNLLFGFFLFQEQMNSSSLICLTLIMISALLLTFFELDLSKEQKKALT